ncbi:MAG: tetratricopeptide repeat protein [Paludibacter sp.]
MRNIFFLFFLVILSFYSCATPKKAVAVKPQEIQLSDASKRQFEYYFYEGLRLRDDRKFDQALEVFQLCVSIDSLDAGAQSEIGILYSAIGIINSAVKHLENAVRLDPTNWWYNLRLITLHTELKNWKRAIEITNALQKNYPNKEEVYNILASVYKETKEYDKAIAAYDKLEGLTGIDESLSIEKFQLYLASNKPKKAVAEIDKLINKFPTETRYRVLRGDIFMQQKMPEQAYAIYQKVLTDDPQNANVYISLSEYYNEVNQPEKALESIVSALKNEDLDVETKVGVLGQYVEKLIKDSTKFAETESLFKLLVDRYPLEEQVHGYYAVFLQFRKRNTEAISEYETMLNINPKNDQTWLRLIQVYASEQNFKQMITVTARAIEKLPKIPTWYFYRGIAQYQLVDYPAALSTYKTALPFITAEQAGLKSDFYAQIADIYFKLEQKDSAFVNYERSLAANPKNIMVMNNYAYYLSLEKAELKKAERMSAKTVELEPKNSTYLDTYAWILYQQGNYSLAKFYIEKAIDNLAKQEDHGVIMEHYGDILWMNSKDAENDGKALEMWQKSYDAGNKTDEIKQKIENKGWIRK